MQDRLCTIFDVYLTETVQNRFHLQKFLIRGFESLDSDTRELVA